MGLFDSVMGAVQNQVTGGKGVLLNAAMAMVNDPKIGGLSGLLQKISQGGLAEQVASWVGTGENLPVSGEQIQTALGSSMMQDIAGKLGVDTGSAADSLAKLLPQVIDKLTPNGQIPEGNVDFSQALSGLAGIFAK